MVHSLQFFRPKQLVLVLVLAFVAAVASSDRSAEAHGGAHQYNLFSDRWYQQYSDSGSYGTWMTLSYDRHYTCTGCESKWASYVASAINDWNGTATTIVYSYVGSHSASNDVHTYILNNSGLAWGGLSEVYEESYTFCTNHDCTASQSRPNTWWYAYSYANDYYFPSPSNEMQAVMAHELGHNLSQAHPVGGGSDGVWSNSIMDYDYIYAGGYLVSGPYDVCGVNHAYYDPGSGYSGCN